MEYSIKKDNSTMTTKSLLRFTKSMAKLGLENDDEEVVDFVRSYLYLYNYLFNLFIWYFGLSMFELELRVCLNLFWVIVKENSYV